MDRHHASQTDAQVQYCFASTDTGRTVRDGEPRTTTSIFTQLLNTETDVKLEQEEGVLMDLSYFSSFSQGLGSVRAVQILQRCVFERWSRSVPWVLIKQAIK